MNEGETSTRLGLIGHPSEAEVIIIDRDLHLLRRAGAATMRTSKLPALTVRRASGRGAVRYR